MFVDIFNNLWSIIKTIQFRDIVDILAIALLIFGLFKLIRETRAVQLFKGLLLLFVVYILASLFNLVMLSTLLRSFFEANTPRSFQVTHKASESNKKYLIGLLNAGGEIFQVTIYATASAGDTYKIQQLNISRQTAY